MAWKGTDWSKFCKGVKQGIHLYSVSECTRKLLMTQFGLLYWFQISRKGAAENQKSTNTSPLPRLPSVLSLFDVTKGSENPHRRLPMIKQPLLSLSNSDLRSPRRQNTYIKASKREKSIGVQQTVVQKIPETNGIQTHVSNSPDMKNGLNIQVTGHNNGLVTCPTHGNDVCLWIPEDVQLQISNG